MNFSIELDHEQQIVRYRHWGDVHAEEIEAAWAEFMKLPEFTREGYNLLSDYSEGKFNIPMSHMPVIIEFLRDKAAVVKGKKQALVVSDSYAVAGSFLLQNKVVKAIGFRIGVYSTPEAALDWLMS